MRKPIIGISGVLEEVSGRFCLHRAYSDMIWESGGVPLFLPFGKDAKESAKEYCELVDGILLSGGGDVHPKYYGKSIANPATFCSELERDVFELALFDCAKEKGLPILGICRGIQLMAVALGGELVQEVKGHSGGIEHRVVWQRADAKTPPFVNSYHCQAVAQLGAGAEIFVTSEDGVCEGFLLSEYPFAIGVQWHPERQKSAYDKKLFADFISACCDARVKQDGAHGAEH